MLGFWLLTTTFEEGELRPTQQAVQTLEGILNGAEELQAKIPAGEVFTWYGELGIVWKIKNRTLQLVAFSNGEAPLLYFQTDNGKALTRGELLRPATARDLKDKLEWLLNLQTNG